jgi:tetratricopeptide (TPR) repeat protein
MRNKWSEYLHLLNTEAEAGTAAANELLAAPVPERDALLRDHPAWLRIGTMNALLAVAREELDRQPTSAEAIVTLVVRHLNAVPAPPGAPILLDRLHGTAWKDRGSVHYRRDEPEAALAAAKQAIAIFSRRPALIVHRASALLLLAQVWHALGHTPAALDLLSDCQVTFGQHGDARHWVQAVEMRAFCEFDLGEGPPPDLNHFRQARTLLLEAQEEALRLRDARELARIHNSLGYCSLALVQQTNAARQYADAQRYFGKAFTGFSALRMDAEVQRTVFGIADLARQRGQIDQFITMMRGVYTEFFQRDMLRCAAVVLLAIADGFTAATGDVLVAKEECDRLVACVAAATAAPANVSTAVGYAQQKVAHATTAAEVHEGLAPAQAFFTAYADRADVPFSPAA